ncbi:hypothetical protein Acr_29g0007870 [Actinidia rufa]|uniref:Uncharacterized protein n=1 Tax=Actinidia rufa TaxID=165716 RepID=A0A7J0HF81_9ERIC|nr:hypothetical protein Acr_29g0007870 [Actinidia rufa]
MGCQRSPSWLILQIQSVVAVVDRFERRLPSWKRQYLFKGGKLTLIKSTLSNMSTYFLTLLTIPKSIALGLEKLVRDFLWKGLENAPGEDKLWCRVIKGKYGINRGAWRTKDIIHPYGTGLWKGIMKVWGIFFPMFLISWGMAAKFLFAMTAGAAICLIGTGEREAQGWELEAFEDFFRLLQEVHPISQEVDKWRWKRQGKGSFSVFFLSFYYRVGIFPTSLGKRFGRSPQRLKARGAVRRTHGTLTWSGSFSRVGVGSAIEAVRG